MTGDEEEERVMGGGRVGEDSVGGGRVGEERVGGGEKVEREQMEEGEELMDGEATVMEVELNLVSFYQPTPNYYDKKIHE